MNIEARGEPEMGTPKEDQYEIHRDERVPAEETGLQIPEQPIEKEVPEHNPNIYEIPIHEDDGTFPGQEPEKPPTLH